MSSQNISNKFNSFIQEFNNKRKTTYKLDKTIVYTNANKWILNISGEKIH